MKEREGKEPVTLERHVWRALGILIVEESIRVLANGWEAANTKEAIEHLILGLAIPAWYLWGQGVATFKKLAGSEVDEREYRDWAYKDIIALFGFLDQRS